MNMETAKDIQELREAFPGMTDTQLLENALMRMRYLANRIDASRRVNAILKKKNCEAGIAIRELYRQHFQ